MTYLLIVPLASFPVLKWSYRGRGVRGYTNQKEWYNCEMSIHCRKLLIRATEQTNNMMPMHLLLGMILKPVVSLEARHSCNASYKDAACRNK
jgi:hypothetical protein